MLSKIIGSNFEILLLVNLLLLPRSLPFVSFSFSTNTHPPTDGGAAEEAVVTAASQQEDDDDVLRENAEGERHRSKE